MSEREKNFKNKIGKLQELAEDISEHSQGGSELKNEIIKDELPDKYIIGPVIAEGGLKIVHEATDSKTGRTVAMAKLKNEDHSILDIERFIREARTLANLEHSNIVPIYEINHNEENGLFFTMKLLTGDTLATILNKKQKGDEKYINEFPERKLLHIFTEVCDAVYYAHSNNIIHLDIKPQNIQISEYGEVSLLDWGIARKLVEDDEQIYSEDEIEADTPLKSALTHVGRISGTPTYMSPEQTSDNKDKYSTASDIYSLGATLYHIIYGEVPFHPLSPEEIINAKSRAESPEFPDQAKGKTLDPSLKAIIRKTMMSGGSDRYKSASDLKKDIELYLNDFTTQAENLNVFRFGQLFIKRNAKAIIIAAAILIISAISVQQFRQAEKLKDISKAEQIKVSATADEIITGTLKKHDALRLERKYAEILANYEKLKGVGYNYPEFWLDEARLYAGELNFEKSLECFKKIEELNTDISQEDSYQKLKIHVERYAKTFTNLKLRHKDIITLALNADWDTRDHILWNINTDSKISLEKKLGLLRESLIMFNKGMAPEELNYHYNLNNDYLIVDLSNNPQMSHFEPLLGLPMDELNLSNTDANLGVLREHLKQRLKVLNVSNTKATFITDLITRSKMEKIIARNSQYAAGRLQSAKSVKYLDIQGANIVTARLYANNTLEHLNIAFTNFKDLHFLAGQKGLKTLVIDNETILPDEVMSKLSSRGTEIIIKDQNN